MTNLYRKLNDKGYTTVQVDEILYRIGHRLPISIFALSDFFEYFTDYIEWNKSQDIDTTKQ